MPWWIRRITGHAEGADMRKRRVMLIDDNPFVLDMMKLFFERRGYEVIACGDAACCPEHGKQKKCGTTHPCVDILITDYKMPGMTGLELLKEQEKIGCRITTKNKAVISGHMDAAAVTALDAMGCARFDKPFTFDELEKWLCECEQRTDPTLPLGDKRKELRRSCSSEAILQLESGCQAEVVNRSGSGLCVKVRHSLTVGQKLDLQTDMSLASRRLLVRWTRPANEGCYFVGMSCC
jgi:CheY-like chemotaxis protein